jgi:hypothetical protein
MSSATEYPNKPPAAVSPSRAVDLSVSGSYPKQFILRETNAGYELFPVVTEEDVAIYATQHARSFLAKIVERVLIANGLTRRIDPVRSHKIELK